MTKRCGREAGASPQKEEMPSRSTECWTPSLRLCLPIDDEALAAVEATLSAAQVAERTAL